MSETNSGKAAATIYCSNCGSEAKAIAKFCFACGEAIYRGPSIEALPRSQAEPAPPLPAEEAEPAPPLPAEEAGTTQPSLDEAIKYLPAEDAGTTQPSLDEALKYLPTVFAVAIVVLLLVSWFVLTSVAP